MKNWIYILRLFLYWMLFFTAFRLLFLVYNALFADKNSLFSLTTSLALDASTVSYLLAFPFLLVVLRLFISNSILRKLALWFNRGLLLFLVVFCLSNLILYREWHTLLNQRAIDYLRSPEDLLLSVHPVFLVVILFGFGLFAFGFDRLRQKLVDVYFPKTIGFSWIALFLTPLIFGFLAICLRGGLGVMPINESAVYYSPNMFNNHAATNPVWHFVHTLIEKRAKSNPYQLLSSKEVEEYFPVFFKNKVEHSADTIKPNVVILGLESLSSQFLESYGGFEGLMPFLDSLIQENTYYSRCYSSGYRTDQGFAALLSGYPALPDQSIILLEDKVRKLPSLPRAFEENGYHTAFFYGGELTFANLGTYVAQMGFDKVIGKKDFPSEDYTQRWGVDDKHFLERTADEIAALPEPYFTFAMTLSCHAPFDAPGTDMSADENTRFKDVVRFVDTSLAAFFEKMKKLPSYERTIFVLVADHGHPGVHHYYNDQVASRHLPLIIVDNRQPKHPQKNDFICNHHDLPQILLDKLGMQTTQNFVWSKSAPADIDTSGGFAYYTYEDGVGWICPRGSGFYRFSDANWVSETDKHLDENQKKTALAYLQRLYDHFIKQ